MQDDDDAGSLFDSDDDDKANKRARAPRSNNKNVRLFLRNNKINTLKQYITHAN